MNCSPQPSRAANAASWTIRLGVLAAVLGAILAAWPFFGQYLSLEYLSAREAELVSWGRQYPAEVIAAAFAIYVTVTALSLPGAAVLTLTLAWLFHRLFGGTAGFAVAVLLVSFASTTGATLAFLLSRYLFRAAVQRRFRERLADFNAALQRDGALYLLTLRLIWAVPFFVINLVMGLTPIKVRTFWWVSQVGMLPGTCAYVYAGWSVPSLSKLAERGTAGIVSPHLLIAFALLGVFPLLVRKLLAARSRRHLPQ